jgi:Cu+-exporting ATPase
MTAKNGIEEENVQQHHAGPDDGAAGSTVMDPVCGMRVDPTTTSHQTTVGTRLFYFCSERCEAKFKAEPQLYLEKVQGGKEHSHAEHGRAGQGHSDHAHHHSTLMSVAWRSNRCWLSPIPAQATN